MLEDSYVKYNGVKISGFSTSVCREDFEGNTAYLGVMTAQSADAKFTTNKTVNSVVPIFDDQNRETTYKLKSNTDLTFKVANVVDNDLTIKYGDKTLVKGTEYTFENNTVVLKGSYLKRCRIFPNLTSNFRAETLNRTYISPPKWSLPKR